MFPDEEAFLAEASWAEVTMFRPRFDVFVLGPRLLLGVSNELGGGDP